MRLKPHSSWPFGHQGLVVFISQIGSSHIAVKFLIGVILIYQNASISLTYCSQILRGNVARPPQRVTVREDSIKGASNDALQGDTMARTAIESPSISGVWLSHTLDLHGRSAIKGQKTKTPP